MSSGRSTSSPKGGQAGSSIVPLSSPKIWHDGQIVAMVVAETFEAASEAARKIGVATTRRRRRRPSTRPERRSKPSPTSRSRTRIRPSATPSRRSAAAPVTVDAEYATPTQHHNPMELFATTCVWDDDKLTVYEPSQFVYGLKYGLAEQLGIDPDRCARGQPVRRRRIRLEGLADPTHRADRDRRAAPRPAGQAGRDPQPGLHHRDLSRRDPSSCAARRRARTANSSPTCTRRGSSLRAPTTTMSPARRARR